VLVVGLLSELPNISHSVRLWSKCEVRLCDEIDDFVGGQEVSGVEVDTTLPPPDDDLPYRKPTNNVLPVLEKAILDSPLVVVENGTIRLDESKHLGEAGPLPCHVFLVRHVVGMLRVTLYQGGRRPLAASTVFHSVAGRVLQVVWGRRDDKIDGLIRQFSHFLDRITADDFVENFLQRASGRLPGSLCLGRGLGRRPCFTSLGRSL